MAAGDKVVELEAVTVRYGDGQDILSDLSLDLEAGSFHFLTGPSGAGKSTLIRLLLLSLRPTHGSIRLFGQDCGQAAGNERAQIRRRLGIVFQDFRLLDHLTVYENVALPLRVQGYEEATYRGEVVELLQWVGLSASVHARPATLSGGEQQRVAIARAVIARPDLILADEPTGNVDPALARRLLHLFVEMNRFGASVILATHDHGLMEQIEAPRLLLQSGRLALLA